MDTTSVPTAPRPDTRELRALALYRERGAEIVRTGPHTYLVPSCSGGEPYAVDYAEETCECPDFTIPRPGREPGEPCKHVYAVGIHRAKRRGTTVRKLAALEETYRHELRDAEDRGEIYDRIVKLRAKLGL